MASPAPRVTVVLPVRNGAATLEEAIASILGQTFEALELVVVDDGSTDESLAIARHWQAQDRRVRVEAGEPVGVAAALNRGVEAARAPLIAIMHGDDVALPKRLERQVAFLEAHPGTVVVGAWIQVMDAGGRPLEVCQFPTDDALLRWRLLFDNPIPHPAALIRRDALRAVGGYRAEVAPPEDYDLWVRISRLGALANLPEVLLRYRRHAGSLSQTREELVTRNAVRISGEAMAALLGRPARVEVVRRLRTGDMAGSADARAAARLVADLHRAFVRRHRLDRAATIAVGREAAAHLYRLARQKGCGLGAWPVLAGYLVSQPGLAPAALTALLHRLKRRRQPLSP